MNRIESVGLYPIEFVIGLEKEGEMKRVLIALGIVMLISLMTSGNVWAQATAQISGAVQDQSGAVLPGVEITATQTDTGVSRMTITNETGSYVLPNLPLGPYRLEAALPGFRTFVQTGIVLQVGSNPTLNVVLEVGQVSEQVEVQANAALVETRSLSVGQVMETARIMELPLNGRNAQELLLLGGGAVASSSAPVDTLSAGQVDDLERRQPGHVNGVHPGRDSPCRSL